MLHELQHTYNCEPVPCAPKLAAELSVPLSASGKKPHYVQPAHTAAPKLGVELVCGQQPLAVLAGGPVVRLQQPGGEPRQPGCPEGCQQQGPAHNEYMYSHKAAAAAVQQHNVAKNAMARSCRLSTAIALADGQHKTNSSNRKVCSCLTPPPTAPDTGAAAVGSPAAPPMQPAASGTQDPLDQHPQRTLGRLQGPAGFLHALVLTDSS